MRKFLFFIFLSLSMITILAAEEKNKIEVTAKHLNTTRTTVKATGGVVVYYQNSVIEASSAFYNKETKLLVLDGNVEMIGYKGTKEHTKHLEIQTESEEVTFKELFFVSKNDVWLFSDKAHRSEGNYTFGMSMLSSCEVNDPLWKMIFSRSIYNSETKYMKVYDAKVYFLDMPIFYTPYLAFSTDNKRSSGLLFPLLGYSEKEGFIYEQPIFWAISPSMDMEVNPQIRTNRSVGFYSTVRFVDSNHSSGELRIGYFKNKESYIKENNLPHSSHYGLEFNYESSKILSDKLGQGFTDGLYINTTFLNDIDYLNLQNNELQHFGLSPLQESRVNYFLYNDNYYAGVNAKYFIDTRKDDNDDTLQILPSVQFHKYLDYFLWNNLTYSANFYLNNFDRKKGATMRQAELKIPLEFTTSFFDDFANLSLGEDFYYSKFFFGNGLYTYDDFQYYSNIHKVKLFTDLTKKYKDFIHVLQPSLQYIKPGSERQSPVKFSSLNDEQKALFAVGLPEEEYDFSLSQYFYDKNMNLKFYQRFTQKYYVNRPYSSSDTSNEMQYNGDNWNIYNNIIYSQKFAKIRESSSRFALNETDYHFGIGHTYKQVLPDLLDSIAANDIDLIFGYTLNEKIKLDGGFTYNIDKSSSKQWNFRGSYEQDCWSMAALIKQEITPRPVGYTTNTSFYVQFNFIPFGSIGTADVVRGDIK